MKAVALFVLLLLYQACSNMQDINQWIRANQEMENIQPYLLRDLEDSYQKVCKGIIERGDKTEEIHNKELYKKIYYASKHTCKYIHELKVYLIKKSGKNYHHQSLLGSNYHGCYTDLAVVYNPMAEYFKTGSLPEISQQKFKNSCLAIDLAYLSHLQNTLLRQVSGYYTEKFLNGDNVSLWSPENFRFALDFPDKVFEGDTIPVGIKKYVLFRKKTTAQSYSSTIIINQDTFPVKNGFAKISIPSQHIGEHTFEGKFLLHNKHFNLDTTLLFQIKYKVVAKTH